MPLQSCKFSLFLKIQCILVLSDSNVITLRLNVDFLSHTPLLGRSVLKRFFSLLIVLSSKEFDDPRDAEDAVYELDGKELCNERYVIPSPSSVWTLSQNADRFLPSLFQGDYRARSRPPARRPWQGGRWRRRTFLRSLWQRLSERSQVSLVQGRFVAA